MRIGKKTPSHHHVAPTLWLALALIVIAIQVLAGAQEERPRRVSPPAAQQPQKPTQTPKKDQPDEAGEAIKISSNLVTVPVSVTDAAGEPVRNLKAQDFKIEEEGEPQQISLLGQPGKTPLELALLFDVSGSVLEKFQFEQQAAARFLKIVAQPQDQVVVFSIGIISKRTTNRTSNIAEAISGVDSLVPSKEPTAFYDTVGDAAKFLGQNSEKGARRVLVVISDGEDNLSERYRLEDSLREMQRNDCIFYSINPSGPSIRLNKISMKGQDAMIALAAETGGVAFLPDRVEDLDRIFRQIATELQAQYLLGYYPTNEASDGKFRRITARVTGRPELRVRSRQGYYAPKG